MARADLQARRLAQPIVQETGGCTSPTCSPAYHAKPVSVRLFTRLISALALPTGRREWPAELWRPAARVRQQIPFRPVCPINVRSTSSGRTHSHPLTPANALKRKGVLGGIRT